MSLQKSTLISIIPIIAFLILWYALELPDSSPLKTVIYGIFIVIVFIAGIWGMAKSRSGEAAGLFFISFIIFDNNNLWLPLDNERIIFESIRVVIFLFILFAGGAYLNKKLQKHNSDYKSEDEK